MGHKHSREDILAGALETAVADGLSQLSFGRVAKHLGINDRTVVYYFPTKDDLIVSVVLAMGAQLQDVLSHAFTQPAENHLALVRAAWPALSQPAIDSTFSLFFEMTGLAAAGREPYASLAPQLIGAWTDWLAQSFSGPPERRSTEAEAAIALVDGLLLLRQLRGHDAAQRAAVALGIA